MGVLPVRGVLWRGAQNEDAALAQRVRDEQMVQLDQLALYSRVAHTLDEEEEGCHVAWTVKPLTATLSFTAVIAGDVAGCGAVMEHAGAIVWEGACRLQPVVSHVPAHLEAALLGLRAVVDLGMRPGMQWELETSSDHVRALVSLPTCRLPCWHKLCVNVRANVRTRSWMARTRRRAVWLVVCWQPRTATWRASAPGKCS